MLNQFPELNGRRLVFEVVRHIIHVLVDDLVKETQHRIKEAKPQSVADVRKANALVGFSDAMRAQATEMKRFLFKNLYRHPQVNQMTKEASEMIVALFHHYENQPSDLPFDFRPNDELHRRIAHYIAGMTDRYANKEFQKLMA